MKYLPAWCPGAGFKRQAARWKVDVDDMFERPFQELKAAFVVYILAAFPGHTLTLAAQEAGRAKPCVLTELLSSFTNGEVVVDDYEEVMMSIAGTAYLGRPI